jgi:transmembrane sensor
MNDELIVRYLAGEATPEEAMALEDWLTSPENRLYFEELQATWSALSPLKKQRNVHRDEAWKIVDRQLDADNTASKTKTFNLNRFVLRIAASVMIVVAASLIIYLKIRDVKSPAVNIATTNSAEHVTFPDNSTATVYRNSAVSYPEHFKDDLREVQLSRGEVFFNITPDKQKPFLIHTPIASVKVVGTSFNVRMNAGELEVGVHEGTVLVYTSHDSVYLEAGFTGVVQLATRSVRVQDSINANAWGYATGKFSYSDTPLPAVIADIEKAYPCSIKLKNPAIEKCRLTATFDHVSAENIINLIAETLNLTVAKNGTVFILEGEGCP